MEEKILQVQNLKVSFKTDQGIVKAVRGVSFDLYKGETLCIVGESGSGKSVTSKAIMGILANNAIVEDGKILYEGENLLKVSEEEFHRLRGHKIGMIFQDPLSSLNPIMKVGDQIIEAMLINSNLIKKKYEEMISPELIKYKNALQALQQDIELLEYEFNGQIKNKNKKEISSLKKELNNKIKKLKNDSNENISLLKKELANKKILAKKEIKKYKLDLKKELNQNILKVKQENISNKEKQEKIKLLKQEHQKKIKISKKAAKEKALKIMEEVGISYPEKRFKQYPFEFSGGMRQRIVIAIALTADPDILICDEPTTALDVTIQAQILELINNLKKERNLSCIFITHDLGVVANMADRVAVMYAGKIVEYGLVDEIFYNPKHPYTWALLSSIPDVDSKEKLESIPGTPPNMIYPPVGDAFALRSKYALKIDFEVEPPLFDVSPTHKAATWLLYKNAPHVEMPKIVKERIQKALKGD